MRQIKTGKRLIFLVSALLALVLAMTIFPAACGEPTPTAPAEPKPPAPTPPKPVEPVTLVFTSHNSGDGFWRKSVIEPYFLELEKRTNGQVKVEQHWNGELVNLIDAYDFMLKGSVDLAEYFPSMLAGRFPMDDVMPFSPFDAVCYRPGRVVYELGQTFPQMLEPYKDAKLLWREPGYSVGMVTTKAPIRTLEGSKGLKIGPVGQWSAALIEALGWVPTPVPPEDATSALQTGVQDGSGISMYLLWEFGWGPIMKYLTYPIHVDEMLVNCSMNIDTWNSLPPDVQGIINDMEEWIVDLQDKAVLLNWHESLPLATSEFGIEVIELPLEEQEKMNAAIKPVQEAFIADLEAKGLPGQELMDKYLELTYKYSEAQYRPW